MRLRHLRTQRSHPRAVRQALAVIDARQVAAVAPQAPGGVHAAMLQVPWMRRKRAKLTGATTDGAQRRREASGLSERSDGTLLSHEPLSKTFTGFSDLHFSISRRCTCFQGAKKIAGDCCDLLNRSKECSLVCFRWLVEAANLSHELQGSRANLFFRHRRREIKKDLDISTHVRCSQCFGPPNDGRVTPISIVQQHTSGTHCQSR